MIHILDIAKRWITAISYQRNLSRIKYFLPMTAFLIVILISGCSLAPKYIRPDAPIPDTYPKSPVQKTEALPDWKYFFQDSSMQQLIELALENNRNLKEALLNVKKIRATYQVQRADLLPSIGVEGRASLDYQPADISGDGVKGINRQYTAQLGFSSFELDIFGRVRNLSSQALETYYSAENEAKAVRLTLIAETAAMYLQLVANRNKHDLAVSTVESRRKSLELIRNLQKNGLSSELEVNQAQSLLEEARVRMTKAAAVVDQDINNLILLMGMSLPDSMPEVRELSKIAPLYDVPEGLPSSLLERRPDILAAEHILKGANANIGAARANFFPKITLTGFLGQMSSDYHNLWSGNAGSWSFLPQVSLPIFDMGRNIARLKISKVEKELAVTHYEKSIQNAFTEVANALVKREHMTMQLQAQESLVTAFEQSHRHATKLYRAGLSAFINVLDSERSLFNAKNDLISLYLQRETNALMLYKSLGGGWDNTTE